MITRRVFLRRSASALAAGILVPQVLKAQTLGAAPSDQLRVALIGCKSMGWKDLTTFMKHAGVSCVALCDIDNNILESRADQARKLWGTRPETYTDYRRVLDRKDVDAVKAILQTRIDNMANGGAFYPEPTRLWTECSQVVSNGNYVMMVVNESYSSVVKDFNALF